MNTSIKLHPPKASAGCRVVEGADRISEMYALYLSDESKKTPSLPERIYFPETTAEVSYALHEIATKGEQVTVSGSRTGLAGGAVAAAENLITLEGLKGKIENTEFLSGDQAGGWTAHVMAGTTLAELREESPAGFFYPVDPTETSASVGGTVATNASGARTLKYGPTREWVRGVTGVLADGSYFKLSRGDVIATDSAIPLRRPDGTILTIPIGNVRIPSVRKHTGGYPLSRTMDAIDLFIGSEGTLCVITEVELALIRLPETRLSLFIFPQQDHPANLVAALLMLEPTAVEYMDSHSIDLLRTAKARNEDAGAVPEIPDDANAALYVEFEASGDADLDAIYERLTVVLDKFNISEANTWAGFEQSDLDSMKALRHALPERINSIIGTRKREEPELTKVGTDMAVPDEALERILKEYRDVLDETALEYCIFGHIGNAHLHVNILPRTMDELNQAYSLYTGFAGVVVDLGGSVAGEHGIGRLKKLFLAIQYSTEEIEHMKQVKRILDPAGILNPGVLYDL